MSLLRKVGSLVRDYVIFFVLVALLVISIYGTKTPPQRSIPFGSYQVSVFDTGLAIYADGRKTPYWSISPLNDYFLKSDGTKEILLSGRVYEEGKFETNLKKEKFAELLETKDYFIGKKTLLFELKKVGLEATYKALVDGNQLVVERIITNANPLDIVATGITLSFSGSDLIYEPSTSTFIFYSNLNDPQLFSRFIDGPISLYPYRPEEYLVVVPSGEVVLVNKYLPGGLLISAGDGQRLIVDTRFGVILTEQQLTDASEVKTKISLEFLEGPGREGKIK